jgi:hypothetical protein
MVRSYRDLRRLLTFEDRFEYLALRGQVGAETFGWDRYLNQQFYRSVEWRHIRKQVIVRDLGCDLGVEGYEIHDAIYIHHLNPMTIEEIKQGDPRILDLDNLISTTHNTHNAIHYGDASLLPRRMIERRRGDTKLW